MSMSFHLGGELFGNDFSIPNLRQIDELDRHRTRLYELKDRVFVLQFLDATGSLASLSEEGGEVQRLLAEEID